MNKRSKVVLIIFIVVVLFVFASLLSDGNDKSDENLADFENEIIDPNNELNPLDYDNNNNVLLIKVALKAEGIIDSIFSTLVNIIKGLTEKII